MALPGIDPIVGFSFGLDLSGKLVGLFTEVGGLGSETEVIEHKVVDSLGRDVIRKIPGRTKFNDITLKRGVTAALDMWEWRKLVEDGKIDSARVNGSVIMYDQTHSEVARWNFENMWPSKISGPQMQADSNNYAVEEITITFDFMWREK